MKRTLFVLLASLYVLAGCNTIEGMGKDIQKGGEKIEDAARENKILATAERNAEDGIRAFVTTLGFDEVRFR